MAATEPSTINGRIESEAAVAFRDWFDAYLKTIIGTAVLGGQITFTVIVSDILDPSTLQRLDLDSPTAEVFSKEQVRFFIALSWLCFTATLGLAIVTKLVFTNAPLVIPGNGRLRPSNAVHGVLTLLLNALSISAFTLLSLAVTAYVPIVGCLGVVMLVFYAILVLWLWLVMNTGFKNSIVAPLTGPFRPDWSGSQDGVASSTAAEYNIDQQVGLRYR